MTQQNASAYFFNGAQPGYPAKNVTVVCENAAVESYFKTTTFINTTLIVINRFGVTVTFETNGGSRVSAQYLYSGMKAEKPDDPKKHGFFFEGWFSDEDLENPWDFGTDFAAENMTLYAKWDSAQDELFSEVEKFLLKISGDHSLIEQYYDHDPDIIDLLELKLHMPDPIMPYVTVRTPLDNTAHKLQTDKKLTVAYLGGSVTNGTGASDADTTSWRALTYKYLSESFEGADITQINASLGSNGSKYQLYFAEKEAKNADLYFIDSAINDTYENLSIATQTTNLETVIRRIYIENPNADIVIVHISNNVDSGGPAIENQKAIAEKYDITTVDLRQALADASNQYENWDEFVTDAVHPNDKGYEVFAAAVYDLLDTIKLRTPSGYTPKVLPDTDTPLKMDAIGVFAANVVTSPPAGWTKESSFTYQGTRYNGALKTLTADRELTVTFTGTEFGIVHHRTPALPPSGMVSYEIDGGTPVLVNKAFAGPGQMIETWVMASGLENKTHTIKIKMTTENTCLLIGAFFAAGAGTGTSISVN